MFFQCDHIFVNVASYLTNLHWSLTILLPRIFTDTPTICIIWSSSDTNLMNEERAECSNLKFCETIRHVHPHNSKRITKGVLRHIIQSIFYGFYRRQTTGHYQWFVDRHPGYGLCCSRSYSSKLRGSTISLRKAFDIAKSHTLYIIINNAKY